MIYTNLPPCLVRLEQDLVSGKDTYVGGPDSTKRTITEHKRVDNRCRLFNMKVKN